MVVLIPEGPAAPGNVTPKHVQVQTSQGGPPPVWRVRTPAPRGRPQDAARFTRAFQLERAAAPVLVRCSSELRKPCPLRGDPWGLRAGTLPVEPSAHVTTQRLLAPRPPIHSKPDHGGRAGGASPAAWGSAGTGRLRAAPRSSEARRGGPFLGSAGDPRGLPDCRERKSVTPRAVVTGLTSLLRGRRTRTR